jgi:hypothetical protein
VSATVKKTSRIIEGAGRREHRNFQWLEYFPGAIAEVPLSGLDVLTGKMTGCWLVIYKKPPDKIVTVAHIGTEDSPTTEGTVAVKRTWNTFAGTYPIDVIAGFRPSNAWRDSIPPMTSGDIGAEIYGLVTADKRLYSIFTYIQRGSDLRLLRIAGIQEMQSVEPRELTDL